MDERPIGGPVEATASRRSPAGEPAATATGSPPPGGTPSTVPGEDLEQRQRRRHLTMLFADVVGSTRLSRQLGPEDTYGVMEEVRTRCAEVITSHRGTVLQYAGDSVLAVFGTPESREDDAQRAVAAGLALLRAAAELRERIRNEFGHEGFDLRVGVHTGTVLLGVGIEAGSIHGEAVSVAARMEQTAPPGALRISRDTYRHVRGVFVAHEQPALRVKGLDEPVVTYLVTGWAPVADRCPRRGLDGLQTPLVGRDRELRDLSALFERIAARGEFALVLLTGEAGVGKSRLLAEFEHRMALSSPSPVVLHGRATPQTPDQPYGLLRDIVLRHLRITDHDTREAARGKFERWVSGLRTHEEAQSPFAADSELLGHLVGLDFSDSRHVRGVRDDGPQLRRRAFTVAAEALRRTADLHGAPLALLLEDMHWSDRDTLDFLARLQWLNADVPTLALALCRPALFERQPGWLAGRDGTRVDLRELDADDSRSLIEALLCQVAGPRAVLVDRVLAAAQGNPFFMEELVDMLIDKGVLVPGTPGWTVHLDRLDAMQVPQTLTAVVQSRLDELSADARRVLQCASVVGLEFSLDALQALDASARSVMPALVRCHLAMARSGHGDEGVEAYAFAHSIVHQATYDTILKRTRRELHARVAAWMCALPDRRTADLLGVIAEHFAQARDAEHACEYFARAAEHAHARHAHASVLDFVARGLELHPHAAEARRREWAWHLIATRERTLDIQGERGTQQDDLDALQRLADGLDDDRRRAEVARRRSGLGLQVGDYALQETSAREALALAARVEDRPLMLEARLLLAIAIFSGGDVAAAERTAEQGLADARELGLRLAEAKYLNALAHIRQRRYCVSSVALHRDSLAIWVELGLQRYEALTLGNLGCSMLEYGDTVQAGRYLEEALRIARAIGARTLEPQLLAHLAVLALERGDGELARTRARESVEVSVDVGAKDFEAIALLYLGEAERVLGELDEAQDVFELAHQTAVSIEHAVRKDALGGLARVALARADVAGARAHVEALLPQFQCPTEERFGEELYFLTRLTCLRVLQQSNDPRAPAFLQRIHAELQAAADAIADDRLRHTFLARPEHRAIVAEWQGATSAGT